MMAKDGPEQVSPARDTAETESVTDTAIPCTIPEKPEASSPIQPYVGITTALRGVKNPLSDVVIPTVTPPADSAMAVGELRPST